jgi:hypothetical protein
MSTGTPGRFLKDHQTFSFGETVLGKVPEFPPWPGRVSYFSSLVARNTLCSIIVETRLDYALFFRDISFHLTFCLDFISSAAVSNFSHNSLSTLYCGLVPLY